MTKDFECYHLSYYSHMFCIVLTFLLFSCVISICLLQAGQKEVCGLDLPPPPTQTDTPTLKKNKSRPPPLKSTTGSVDK